MKTIFNVINNNYNWQKYEVYENINLFKTVE